jgi:dihydrofolate synthase/folylpolyglutamate synthase
MQMNGMTADEAKRFLESLSRFGWRLGLERMHRVLEALSHPESRFRVLHVAGTNGKGSTCAFAASMLRCAGLRVGLYTSPHLVRVNERIQVNGAEISDQEFTEGIEAVLRAFPQARASDDPLTFFEMVTVLALWYFARKSVDVAVLETGLGGRLDATNVVHPAAAVVTRIGLDHTGLLGGTLAAIAGEKAGIFKPGAQAIIARQPSEALEVLETCARAAQGHPRVAGRDFALEGEGPFRFRAGERVIGRLNLSLVAPYQRENAEVAVEAVHAILPEIDPRAVRQGLANTRWPGRLETACSTPLTILDGAHNPDGARALAQAVHVLWPDRRVVLVLGVLADKDYRTIASALLPLACRAFLASPRTERALDAGVLAGIAEEMGIECAVCSSIAAAVRAAQTEARMDEERSLVLVAGSLYVVGEARALLELL